MTNELGVGVVGVGMLGRHHAANLARAIPRARLTAVADARPETARAVAADYGAPRWYTTADELAADPDVEALVIASTDPAHVEGILAAAAHHKDVFCEKPITTTLADADRALAAVEAAGVRLQIGFMRQYDPPYLAAKRQIEAGAIGTPILFRSTHRGKEPEPGPVRAAAKGLDPAVFVNSNIHDYNDARWLLGDEAAEVKATGARLVAPTAEEGIECGLTTIRFRGGALADIEYVSATRYGYDVRAEIVGDRGTLFIGSPNGLGCVLATADGIERPAMDHWLTRFGETYRIELADWVRRMLAGEPPAVTGQAGRAALEIAIAAQRSLATGKSVALPVGSARVATIGETPD